jgi:hypothetical protein
LRTESSQLVLEDLRKTIVKGNTEYILVVGSQGVIVDNKGTINIIGLVYTNLKRWSHNSVKLNLSYLKKECFGVGGALKDSPHHPSRPLA